ncbi:MAG: type II toxin-antitoxin system PemK/MazF family toxin [Gemmataceae bacterium]|nr:type II toxin-antitoxin system PemK/MazF family toxin [Gemmataceae bacterium]
MPLPEPIPGLVLHFAYLWHDQHRRGQEEGTKNRPCVVLTVTDDRTVTVAPVTHTPPALAREGVEVPAATKRRLGLDAGRSWVVLTEVNRFRWPGHDLRPLPRGARGDYAYGVLPPNLFRQIRDGILAHQRAQSLRSTPR